MRLVQDGYVAQTGEKVFGYELDEEEHGYSRNYIEFRFPKNLMDIIDIKIKGEYTPSFIDINEQISEYIKEIYSVNRVRGKDIIEFKSEGTRALFYSLVVTKTATATDNKRSHYIMYNNIIIYLETLSGRYHRAFERNGIHSVWAIFVLDSTTMAKISILDRELTENEIKQLTELKSTVTIR
jgi:hypothetical protein